MKTCSIIGHREIKVSEDLKEKVKEVVIHLIKEKDVCTFLFGSKSKFNSLCYDVITELKTIFPTIKRIFVRAEYPFISNDYYNYLLQFYEDSFYYNDKVKTSRFDYIKRNEYMIKHSNFCLFYFDNNYIPKTLTKSGTAISYDYAVKMKKEIINVAPVN